MEGCGSVEGGRRKGSGMGDGALSGGGVLTAWYGTTLFGYATESDDEGSVSMKVVCIL